MRRPLLLSLLAFAALPLLAEVPAGGSRPHHFVVTLAEGTTAADLAAGGLVVQRMLTRGRALVVAADDAALDSPRVVSIEPFDASKKVFPSARRSSGAAFVTLSVIFHDDVTFDAAQRAITESGGSLQTPLAFRFDAPHRLRALVPPAAVQELAAHDEVLSVAGHRLVPKATNAGAASLSNVTPLYTAPYTLDGSGVVLSEFELARPDTGHPEFGGRLTAHPFTYTDAGDPTVRDQAIHSTHVSGTLIASGIDAEAKGMAPKATLHAFDAYRETALWLADKDAPSRQLGISADNNSWDYGLGWQPDPNSGKPMWTADEFGAYGDPLYSAGYDQIAVKASSPLFVHAAGNDANTQNPGLSQPWSPHTHCCDDNGSVLRGVFCYSQDGTGKDCPTAAPNNCSTGLQPITGEEYCEGFKHPKRTGPNTVGLLGSVKNVVTVGSISSTGELASSSSQGPTMDGRIKPELVARGICQYSTWLSNQFGNFSRCSGTPPTGYGLLEGTSMATPVVTGISGLLVQQWRKTFSGANPSAAVLKTLLIAGATDLGATGPDYMYGFGLVDAKRSVDLIVADAATGARIRTGSVANNQDVHIALTVSSTQTVRVVLGWFDPELFLGPEDSLDVKTLINDLDLSVTGPGGQTNLPYVLDRLSPALTATRGVNNIDTTEEVEIFSATPGTYDIVIHGRVADLASPTQSYVVVANAQLGTAAPPPPPPARRRAARH